MEHQKKYKIIYADPPWAYRNMGNIQATANAQYLTMQNEDICQLPVKEIADDNSILFLWATFPKIQEALDVMKAWGFEYKTVGFVWIKKNKNGSNFFGVGWYTKSNAEVCLIGVKGKAPKISNSISQIIETQREKHSKKPDIVRDKIVEFAGDVPRIELFARQRFQGWDLYGNEAPNHTQMLLHNICPKGEFNKVLCSIIPPIKNDKKNKSLKLVCWNRWKPKALGECRGNSSRDKTRNC